MRVRLLVAVSCLALLGAAATPALADGLDASSGHRAAALTVGRLRLTRGALLPRRDAHTTSLNWSGYAVTGSAITAVSGSWIVPAAGLVPPGFAATWAGIGGYSTGDLIQAGTTEDSLPLFGSRYYAWYEILPASETQISGCSGDPNCTVSPGERVSVNIHQVAADSWSVSLTDANHWSYAKTLSYASSRSSAEWILEAPTVAVQTTLADVGRVAFGPGNTFSDAAGSGLAIAKGGPVSIAMSPGVVNEATPSALASDGESFNVCAFAQTCPTP